MLHVTGVLGRDTLDRRPNALVRALPFVAIGLLPVVLMLPLLAEPMTRDEAVYFTVAMFDDLPYVSVFDHKPPLVYVWYKLALLLAGGEPSVEVARVLVGLHLGAGALLVAWVGGLLGGRRLALAAGISMAAAVSNQYLEFHSSTESLMLPWLVLALGAQIKGVRAGAPRWMFVSGLALGIATMTKSVAATNLALAVFALLWVARSNLIHPALCLRMSGAMVAGFAVVLGFVSLPWIVTGHLGEFMYANVGYNMSYGDRSLAERTFALANTDARVLAGSLWLWALCAAGIAAVVSKRVRPADGLLLAALVGAVSGSAAAGRGFPHYAIGIVPFAALLAGVGVLRIIASSRPDARQLAGIVVLVCAALSMPSLANVYLATPEESMLAKNSYSLHAQRALVVDDVARAVQAHSDAGDRVFEIGLDTQIFVLADREPAAYFNRPLAAFQISPGAFERTMRELTAHPPEIIVDTGPQPFVSYAGTHATKTEGVTDLAPRYREPIDAFVAERYEHVETVEFAEIYRLQR